MLCSCKKNKYFFDFFIAQLIENKINPINLNILDFSYIKVIDKIYKLKINTKRINLLYCITCYILFFIYTIIPIITKYISYNTEPWITISVFLSIITIILVMIYEKIKKKINSNQKIFIYNQIILRLKTEGYNLINHLESKRYKEFGPDINNSIPEFLRKIRRIIQFSVIDLLKKNKINIDNNKKMINRISLVDKYIGSEILSNVIID